MIKLFITLLVFLFSAQAVAEDQVIAYVGQLEDDLEDSVRSVRGPHPMTLGGFSSGGGIWSLGIRKKKGGHE
jgi:hypothetical protein